MRLRLIGVASLLFVSSAHAQSFNCRYARTPDEVTICEDARLSALDERLSPGFSACETVCMARIGLVSIAIKPSGSMRAIGAGAILPALRHRTGLGLPSYSAGAD